MAIKIELRADKTAVIEGYVNAVERRSRVIPGQRGPFVEIVKAGVFAEALSSGKNVLLKLNHRKVLGDTEHRSLTLHEDNIGLYAKAVVSDTDVIEKARKKELRGWSFGFKKLDDSWASGSDGIEERTLKRIELTEVTIVDKAALPVYPATSIEMRGEEASVIEFRSVEDAVDVVDNMPKEPEPAPDNSLYKRKLEILKMKGV